jgi:hypothetical protein
MALSRIVNWDWRPAVFEPSTFRAAAILDILEGGTEWVEVDALDVARTGSIMSEERVKQAFGELPPLPDWLIVRSRSEAELAPLRAQLDEERQRNAAALARLGPEWQAVLKEAAAGGKPPKFWERTSPTVEEGSRAAPRVADPSEPSAESTQPDSADRPGRD